MRHAINRRDFFRLGGGIATVSAARPTVIASAQGGSVGYEAFTDGEVIEGRVFEGFAVGVRVWANNVTIRGCVMRQLRSVGDNGSGVEVRIGAVGTRIVETEVDGSNGISDAAGIALHNGCHGVEVIDCYVHHMQRVGISAGSTTYVEFPAPLPEESEHFIAGNLVEYCGTLGREGDASSGIVILGESHRHTIRENRVRRNRGHGIVLAGSVRGDGTPGTPAFDESPTWNIVADNVVEYNGEDGIRNSGANYTWIRHNFCYGNAGVPINVFSLGGTSDARGVEKVGNREIG